MPNDNLFEWDGTVDARTIIPALLDLALVIFLQTRQTKEGKNSLTPREVGEVTQQVAQWANRRFPSLNFRVSGSSDEG